MNATDRLLIWLVGFVAGFAAATITFGDGGGGRNPPTPDPSPPIPDYVPDWLSRVVRR